MMFGKKKKETAVCEPRIDYTNEVTIAFIGMHHAAIIYYFMYY